MMWVLVATNILALLRCTSGAALPEAALPHSDTTTLVHAGHSADVVLTDQGLQLSRVKKQIHGNIAPTVYQYDANVPSSEGVRERRQLQPESNAIGQPTVQFFTNEGNFNREIQRLFSIIQGQTASGAGQTSVQGANLSSDGGDSALGGESPRQVAVGSSNTNVAEADGTISASTSSGNLNALGNSAVGVSINEANKLVALEHSKNNQNPENSQINLSAQENNELGVPILLPLFSNANKASNTDSTSNNVNQEIEGNFGSEQVESNVILDENKSAVPTADPSDPNGFRAQGFATVGSATTNTQSDSVKTDSISKSLINTENTGIRLADTRPQSSSPGPLNFVTNFPTQSLDTSNLFTNFGNAGASQGTGGQQNNEPVVVFVPNGVRSIFGLNNQLSGGALSAGVNNGQNTAISNQGVAAAGIRRLKDLIKNPTNQSPRDIFLNELAQSGISSPLQTHITNSNPNSAIAQSFSNFGGVNAINVEQNQGNVINQGQSTVTEQGPLQVAGSPQPLTGSTGNQVGLTSGQQQQQPQNIGHINANLPSQAAQFTPNQNFVVIPLHFQNGIPGANNSPVPIADPSDPNGFRAQGFATIGGTNPQGQTQQSITGTNNNSPTSQFTSTNNNIPASQFTSTNNNIPASQFTSINNNSPASQFTSIPFNTFQPNFQQQQPQFGSQPSQLPRVNTQGNNQLTPLPFAPKGPAQVGFFSDRLCTPIHRCKIVSNFGTFIPVRK